MDRVFGHPLSAEYGDHTQVEWLKPVLDAHTHALLSGLFVGNV